MTMRGMLYPGFMSVAVGRVAAIVLVGTFILVLGAVPGGAGDVRIIVDGTSPGLTFEGIGALSAGASSRLLIDYPEHQRSDILDFLFAPRFGASLHHLKVEIGGDVNSTDGTEPSHARNREEFNLPRDDYFNRGYEWWLMKEAKRRNPAIILDVLQWGAPAWIGAGAEEPARARNKRFFSEDNARFIVSFIEGAGRVHGLSIDYCGIWNETPYETAWIKLLRRTLDNAGLRSVKIVAADQTPDIAPAWKIAEEILEDHELAAAVHTIGAHYLSSTAWKHALKEPFASTPEAQRTGKPLWASEDGPWRGDWEGARVIAKMFNRNYVVGRMTKTITWSLITSYYDNLPIPGSGPMRANEPWSGSYELQPALWAIAQTAQFVQPGWRYLDRACGMIPSGGSYVTLRSPTADDWSMIVETMDATAPVTISLTITGGLSSRQLRVWRTTATQHFQAQPSVVPASGKIDLKLEPNAIYSLTTTTGQQKGEARHTVPAQADFPLPYLEDFARYTPGTTAKYFSDLFGVFEVTVRPDGKGNCLSNVIEAPGIEWPIVPHQSPRTIIGSRSWSDYEVSSTLRLTGEGWGAIAARFDKTWESGYWLRLSADGSWQLTAGPNQLARGKLNSRPTNRWVDLSIRCIGDTITPFCDGVRVATVIDTTYKSGLTLLGSGWNRVLFDDVRIRSLAPRR